MTRVLTTNCAGREWAPMLEARARYYGLSSPYDEAITCGPAHDSHLTQLPYTRPTIPMFCAVSLKTAHRDRYCLWWVFNVYSYVCRYLGSASLQSAGTSWRFSITIGPSKSSTDSNRNHHPSLYTQSTRPSRSVCLKIYYAHGHNQRRPIERHTLYRFGYMGEGGKISLTHYFWVLDGLCLLL